MANNSKKQRSEHKKSLMKEYCSDGQFDEFSVADQYYFKLKSQNMLKLQHGDVEEKIDEDGNELLRLLLQAHLVVRTEQEPKLEKVTGADGIDRTHCREKTKFGLNSIFGPVTVVRKGYSARNQPSLFPLDRKLNLPVDSYSHGLRKQCALEVATVSFDQAVARIDRTTGGHVPKRQMEKIAEDVSQYFEEFYQSRMVQVEETEDPLIMSTDAKGIKMRKEALRPATKKAAEKKEGNRKVRLVQRFQSNVHPLKI
jgi:hypothetical protein